MSRSLQKRFTSVHAVGGVTPSMLAERRCGSTDLVSFCYGTADTLPHVACSAVDADPVNLAVFQQGVQGALDGDLADIGQRLLRRHRHKGVLARGRVKLAPSFAYDKVNDLLSY